MKRLLILLFVVLITIPVFAQIIPQGAEWKFLDDGSDQGTAWRELSYDDMGWASGPAQLGYGDGDEATVLSYGDDSNNKYITYYFRKKITIDNPGEQNGLKIQILRDDGALVYINGAEVARSNMPLGTITYQTYAAHKVSNNLENKFVVYYIPSSCLVQGENIVAVEVHQIKPNSSDISFDLQLDFIHLSNYKKAPYVLYPGSNDKMMVLWQTYETVECQFDWGTDTTCSDGTVTTTEYGDDHQHKVELADLTPDTKYYYKVTAGEFVKRRSFRTGAKDDVTDLTFYAYGDTRTNPQKHDKVAERIMDNVSSEPESQTFVVNSGDLVANGDDESDWAEQFFSPDYENIQYMLANLPYLAAVGNHEGSGLYFDKYFPFPMYVSSRFYFSFDYGPAHFIILDQYTEYTPGSTQYSWFVDDLSSTTKPWKFIVMHKPGWSAGGGHENDPDVQNYIQPLCEQYGVGFLISGHNHYYARAVVNGINHITSGGGGAYFHTPDPDHDSIVTVDKSNHFCKLAIHGDTLNFSAIRNDGSVIESFDYINTVTGTGENLQKNKGLNALAYGTSDRLIIVNNETEKVNSEIYSIDGRLIYRSPLSNGRNELRVDVTGVVLVKLTTDSGKSLVKKVLIR
jgi:hypothetical protein